MKRIICLTLCALIMGTSFAQRTQNLQRVNSIEIIKKGIQYHDEGKYKEALAEYAKVPFGDANYDLAVYEKALTQEMMEDYRGAIQSISELAENPSCQVKRNKVFMVLGDCYDYLEQYDKSVEAYDQALQIAPYDYLTLFNKGVSLMHNDKYEEAMECFKKSIFISPAHQGSHFRYGLCCMKLGYTVPGILALNYSTLMNTSSRYCLQALQILENLYENGIPNFNKENDIDISDEYEELNLFYKDIHQLLNTKAVVTQKFHSLTKVNHDIAKYNQLVFSNVKVRPGSRAIEDMLYVPYFKQVLDKKQYNTLCYYQFSETDVDNDKVAKKAAKMKKEFNVLIEDIVDHIRTQAELGLGVENKDNTYYLYSNKLKLNAWGPLNTLFKDKQLQEGEWTTINDNGQIDEIGNYVMDKRHGLARLYQDGEMIQEATWKDGKPEGRVYLYTADPIFHQKIINEEFDIKDGEYMGQYRSESNQGVLQKEGVMVKSEFDGQVKYYDLQGHLTMIENLDNGKPYGQQKTFYPSGQLQTEYRAGNKDEQTEYHEYYIDGTKKQDGFIKDDKRVGQWTSYQPSGEISSTKQYDDNSETDGESIQYFSNGKIDIKITHNHGKNVKYEGYGMITGFPTCTYLFDNGKLTSVTNYMPDGTVREKHSVKSNKVSFDLYSELGYKKLSGTLDADFNWQGLNTVYAANGQVIQECTYKNDQLNGEKKEYYENGRLKAHGNYIDDSAYGSYVEYFDNKENSIATEYYVENDTIKGAAYNYYFDGSMQLASRYDESGKLIYTCSYNPDKTKIQEVYYYHEAPCFFITYNRNNEVIARDTLVNGNGILKNYYPEGQLKSTIPYVGGAAEGTAFFYNLHGQMIDSTSFMSGYNNGMMRRFYPTGELREEVKTIQGNYHGLYKQYSPDGQVIIDNTFEYGDITHARHYTMEGKLFYDITYTNGNRTGITQYFAPDGKTLLYEILYENGLQVSISCAQKGGKMSDFVMIGTEEQVFKAYYPNGALGAVVPFRNGLFNGTKSVYYPNGQAYQTISYANDLAEGTAIYYYANGQMYSKAENKEGLQHGEEIYYYPNGQIKYEGHYYNDIAHGEFKVFDKEGKLIHKVVVYYGDPIVDDRY